MPTKHITKEVILVLRKGQPPSIYKVMHSNLNKTTEDTEAYYVQVIEQTPINRKKGTTQINKEN